MSRFTLCCLVSSSLIVHSAECGQNPTWWSILRITVDAPHTAKLSISEIAEQLGSSRAAARRYIMDPDQSGKNDIGRRNSKLLLQDRRYLTIHGKKDARSTRTVKKTCISLYLVFLFSRYFQDMKASSR